MSSASTIGETSNGYTDHNLSEQKFMSEKHFVGTSTAAGKPKQCIAVGYA